MSIVEASMYLKEARNSFVKASIYLEEDIMSLVEVSKFLVKASIYLKEAIISISSFILASPSEILPCFPRYANGYILAKICIVNLCLDRFLHYAKF